MLTAWPPDPAGAEARTALALLVREEDPDAEASLSRALRPWLRRAAKRRLDSSGEIDDAVSEGCKDVVNAVRGPWKPTEGFDRYCLRTATNAINRVWRRNRGKQVVWEGWPGKQEDLEALEELVGDPEIWQLVARYLKSRLESQQKYLVQDLLRRAELVRGLVGEVESLKPETAYKRLAQELGGLARSAVPVSLDQPRDGGNIPPPEPPSIEAGPEAIVLRESFREAVRECIGRLPGRQREVVAWRLLDKGLEWKEIAAVLGGTADGCKQTYHRAKGDLRKCLKAGGLDVDATMLSGM